MDILNVCCFALPAGVSVAVKTDSLEFNLEIEDSSQQYWINHENNVDLSVHFSVTVIYMPISYLSVGGQSTHLH